MKTLFRTQIFNSQSGNQSIPTQFRLQHRSCSKQKLSLKISGPNTTCSQLRMAEVRPELPITELTGNHSSMTLDFNLNSRLLNKPGRGRKAAHGKKHSSWRIPYVHIWVFIYPWISSSQQKLVLSWRGYFCTGPRCSNNGIFFVRTQIENDFSMSRLAEIKEVIDIVLTVGLEVPGCSAITTAAYLIQYDTLRPLLPDVYKRRQRVSTQGTSLTTNDMTPLGPYLSGVRLAFTEDKTLRGTFF